MKEVLAKRRPSQLDDIESVTGKIDKSKKSKAAENAKKAKEREEEKIKKIADGIGMLVLCCVVYMCIYCIGAPRITMKNFTNSYH